MRKIRVFETPDELNAAAAELFVEIGEAAISKRGQFVVALSGGSTPAPVYKLIAERHRSRLDWKRVFFFFGDERNVPADSPESNYRMANDTLFSALPLHHDSVHKWPTWREVPEKIAEDYALEINHFFQGSPRLDLILLGLGTDCHTASLFPQTSALGENEKIAVANWVEKLGDYRFTLTFPLINNAPNVMFIVSGKEKAEAAAQVLEGEFRPDEFPAQFVDPENGTLYWLVDETAASLLNRNKS
ncbi:MAG: 6-phosphogluconolactonase [Acidobacteriota bacterium]